MRHCRRPWIRGGTAKSLPARAQPRAGTSSSLVSLDASFRASTPTTAWIVCPAWSRQDRSQDSGLQHPALQLQTGLQVCFQQSTAGMPLSVGKTHEGIKPTSIVSALF